MSEGTTEARDWLESLRGTEWVSVEKGKNGRTWPVGELAEALMSELRRNAVALGLREEMIVRLIDSGVSDSARAIIREYDHRVAALSASPASPPGETRDA